MKTLIFALALTAGAAQAQTFIAANEGGGGIVLTFRQCEDVRGKDLWHGYAFDKTGKVLKGCWALLDGFVHMAYENGMTRVYTQDTFTQVGESKKKGSEV